jgi:hypothetical protein
MAIKEQQQPVAQAAKETHTKRSMQQWENYKELLGL